MKTRFISFTLSCLLTAFGLCLAPRAAQATCSAGVGGIKVTVRNTGNFAVNSVNVKFSFQDPNNPGNYFSTNKTTDTDGEACITAGPGAGTVNSAAAAFSVTAADLVGDVDVLITATGFLNGCSDTTNLNVTDTCVTNHATALTFNPAIESTYTFDTFTPVLKIRADRASDASPIDFDSFATRVAGITFNSAETVANVLNQRLWGVNGELYYAPTTLGNNTVTLHYKGFVQRTSGTTYNPSGTTAQVSMSFSTTNNDTLQEALRIPIGATDFADELGNDLSSASLTVLGAGTLTAYDPASATGAAAAALYTPKSNATHAFVEAFDAGGGTATLRANIPNYVNNDATVAPTPTVAQVNVNYDQAAGACTAANNDACGFKFPLKVILKDELGNTHTVASMAALAFNGGGPTQNDGANTAYWASEATGALVAQKDGYVDVATVHTPNLNSFTPSDAQQMTLNFGVGDALAAAPTGVGSAIKGLQFSHKVTFQHELGGAITPTSATAESGGVTCTVSASAAYCPVTEAQDNDGIAAAGVMDGYDGDSGAPQAITPRSAHTDAQVLAPITSIRFSKKFTFADELGGTLTPSAVTAGSASTACTMSGAAAYCPVPEAQDGGANAGVTITLDGYDSDSFTPFADTDRTGANDNQTTLAVAGIDFSKRFAFTREVDSAAIVPSVATAGTGNVACTINGGYAYCPVPFGQDGTDETLAATLDGYDGDSGTYTGTDRTANTDGQSQITVSSVDFAKKITFAREVDNVALSPSAVTAGGTSVACLLNGTGTAYCPVPLTGDDISESVVATMPGYDGDSGTVTVTSGATNRGAQTDAQTVLTYTGLQFAKKVTFANELGTAISPSAVTAGTGNVACLLNGTGTAYCPVPVGQDGGTGNITITIDGYDSDSGTAPSDTARAANDPQTALSYGNLSFSKKVTFTDELGSAITPTSVTAGSSSTACVMSGATAYCPVPWNEDSVADENITMTLDGYVTDSGTEGGRADRTATTDAQTVLTYTNVAFSKRINFTREVDNGALTPTAVTAGSTNVSCTINAGNAYCPVPLAGDDSGENVVATIDGYDGDSGSAGGAANRAVHTDGQSVVTVGNVQFSKKVTGIASEAGVTIALSTVGLTLSAGTNLTNCILDGGNTAFYCPVPLADDDSGENMQVTLDGYVKAAVTASTSANRTAATDAQTSMTLSAVKTSKKLTITREGAGLAYTGATTLTLGASNASCTEFPASSGVYYCPVLAGDDDAGENVLHTKAGFITNSGTLAGANNRANSSSAQTALTLTGVQYALKASMATDQGVPVTVNTSNFPTLTYNSVTWTEAVGNVAYFAPSAVGSFPLAITSVLGDNPNTGLGAATGVGTNATTQTSIELGGPNDPPYSVRTTAVTAGSTVQAKGFTNNVTVDVCSAAVTPATGNCPAGEGAVTGLTIANFFPTINGTYSAPTAFATSSTSGRYLLTISTSATLLDLVNLQTDNDSPVDYLNEDDLALNFVSGVASLTASVDIAGDYLCFSATAGGACSATSSISADNDTTLHLVVKNNDGNTVTTGVDAARSVTVSVTGGPTGELASTTGIVGVNGGVVAVASSATVPLTAGTGNITFRGRTIASGGTKYVLTANTISPVVFPQTGPAANQGHQSMSVDITAGAANKVTLTSATTTATAGSYITISASVTDAYANLITAGGPYAITLAATGGTASYQTNPANTASGVATLNATALSQGSLAFTATSSPTLAGGSNTLTLSFTPGAVASILITPPAAFATDSTGNATFTLRDANGNTLTNDSTTTVTVTADNGSTASLADFAAASTGNLVGDSTNPATTNTTRTKTVKVAAGVAVLALQSRVAGTVNLGASVGAVSATGQATVSAAAFSKLLPVLTGETQVPGSPTGKSGTAPASIETGTSVNAVVKAVDAYYNTVTSETANVTLSSTDDTRAAYTPGATQAFAAGSATFGVTPGTAGDDITYVFTSGTITASVDVDVTVDIDDPTNFPGYNAATVPPSIPASVLATDPANGSSQFITINGQNLPMVTGPNTSETDPSQKLGGGNGISALVNIFIYDRFGNAAANVPAQLMPTIVSTGRAAGAVLANNTPIQSVGGNTDANGRATFDLSNVTNGGVVSLQPQVTIGGVLVNYGRPMRVAFNTDHEAPTFTVTAVSAATGAGAAGFCANSGVSGAVTAVTAGACLVHGDTVAKGRDLTFQVTITDTATVGNPAGLTASALTVTVTGTDIGTQNATVTCSATNETTKTCTVVVPAAALNTAGATRTLRLVARDAAGNTSGATTLDVKVAGGASIANVVNAPNPFNPLTSATKVTFQLGEPSTGTIEIYSLAGHVVRIIPVTAPNGGYHEVVWDGRDNGRRVVANGIYPYRVILRGTTSGAKLVGKGKIAVIK